MFFRRLLENKLLYQIGVHTPQKSKRGGKYSQKIGIDTKWLRFLFFLYFPDVLGSITQR